MNNTSMDKSMNNTSMNNTSMENNILQNLNSENIVLGKTIDNNSLEINCDNLIQQTAKIILTEYDVKSLDQEFLLSFISFIVCA